MMNIVVTLLRHRSPSPGFFTTISLISQISHQVVPSFVRSAIRHRIEVTNFIHKFDRFTKHDHFREKRILRFKVSSSRQVAIKNGQRSREQSAFLRERNETKLLSIPQKKLKQKKEKSLDALRTSLAFSLSKNIHRYFFLQDQS